MGVATDIQNAAMNFANTMANNMTNFATAAVNEAILPVDWYTQWNAPGYIDGYTGGVINAPTYLQPPAVTALSPVVPTLTVIDIPATETAPVFLAAEPILNLPTTPSSSLPSAPGESPEFVSVVIPDVPEFSLPDAPTFSPLVMPDTPSFVMPEFSSELPVVDITAPSDVFSYIEPTYESALLDELKAKLMYDLLNGGYGIDDSDEQRLWERARERELLNAETAIQEATRAAAARGFSMPPGAVNEVIIAAQQNAVEKNSSMSREIMIKKADLYVQNRQFTIQQVRETESMLITMFGYMAERALNAAKAQVELSIAVFNTRVARYNMLLEVYKTSAAVYADLIRGALAKIEAYKAQIEAVRLSADVQKIHTEVYKAQIDGVQALIGMYATEVGALRTVSEIERLKLEAFRTKVDTYTAQVAAKTAEFGMFESQIKGETAKISMYQVQANAYATQVGAYKTKADAAEIRVRAQVQSNASKLDAYKADIARYTAELHNSQVQTASYVSKYEADVRKYSVTADTAIRASQQNVEAGKANAEITTQYANVLLSNVIHSASIYAAKQSSTAATLGNIASSFGSTSAAALSSAIGIATTSS